VKLVARVRVVDTVNPRKTDAPDAHAIGATALRTPDPRVLSFDEEPVALAAADRPTRRTVGASGAH